MFHFTRYKAFYNWNRAPRAALDTPRRAKVRLGASKAAQEALKARPIDALAVPSMQKARPGSPTVTHAVPIIRFRLRIKIHKKFMPTTEIFKILKNYITKFKISPGVMMQEFRKSNYTL